MIQIKHLDGTLVLELEIPEGASVHRELMGEHYMRMQFSLGEPVYLKLGDYVDTNFGRFELTSPYSPKYNTETDGYDYNLQLDAYYIKWKNKKCRYNPKNAASETSFHLTASVSVHLEVILSSINAIAAKDSNFKYSGKDFIYTLKGFDSTNVNTAKYKQYQNTDILSALNDLANIFNCEWWVEDNIIFFGRCENESEPVSFEVNKNVASVTSSESKNEYATRVYAFGSTRNLPKDYRKDSSADITKNGIVQKRLMLPLADCPNGYLQDADVKDETSAVEAVVIDEDIYPRTKCKVSKVETYTAKAKDEATGEEVEQTFYRLTDGSGLNFSTDFILEGETLHILFQSGKMNGMDFECEYNDEKKYYEVIVNEDYGRPLPDTSLHPEVGDDFVLYNWDATKIGNIGLVESAEKELKDAIQKKLDRKKVDPNTYTCKMISWWYEQNRKTSETAISHYAMGQKVSLINASSFDAPRSSRIIGYDIKLDIEYDAPEYLVGEATVYSQAQDLQSQIDSITVNGLSYTGNTGNGGGGQRIYIITSEDSSVESDVNVYSAARTKKQFADKIHNDDIYSLWSFAQSIYRRGVQTHHYKNEGNEDNLFGKGFELIQRTNEQGNSVSRLEVDELLVRMRAVFASLEIRQISYVGGNFVFSPAGGKLYHVVPKGSVYRCYLYSDDGTTATANNWAIDDQALCQTFDIEEGVHEGIKNKRYWRRVVATGKEIISGKTNADGSADITQYQYIDLSKADCEMGSDVPESGDNIVTFGNKTDSERQSVIIISVVGEDAPSIKHYSGINTYALSDSNLTFRVSPIGNRLTGVVNIQAGSTGVEHLGITGGGDNLLRNTGFYGSVETVEVSNNEQMSGAKEMYSPKLDGWAYSNADAIACSDGTFIKDSKSGFFCALNDGYIEQQTIASFADNDYVLSMRGNGSIVMSYAGYSQVLTFGEGMKAVVRFKAANTGGVFRLQGTGYVCEIMLEKGVVASNEWTRSSLDTDPNIEKLAEYNYLSSAIKSGATDVIGGLILTNIIELGNYVDKKLKEVTAGISGIYNTDNDVAVWAGGTLAQAMKAVRMFRDDPTYVPTEEEWESVANAVITHGGRAILNDAIFRGSVYAENGYFKGDVYANNGRFNGEVHATSGTFKGAVYADNGYFNGTVNATDGEFHGKIEVEGGLVLSTKTIKLPTDRWLAGDCFLFISIDSKSGFNDDGDGYPIIYFPENPNEGSQYNVISNSAIGTIRLKIPATERAKGVKVLDLREQESIAMDMPERTTFVYSNNYWIVVNKYR